LQYESQLTRGPRLEVPLDYGNPVAGEIFKLALVKIPAHTDVPYKGTFFLLSPFLNSNVDFMNEIGRYYQPGYGYGWDFVTWDARGQGYSTPTLKCFANEAARVVYANAKDAVTPYGGFTGSFPPTISNIQKNIADNQAIAKQLGDGCATYYGKYMP
jgi:pimeloyl-ACP methyl ester carboxylesterase